MKLQILILSSLPSPFRTSGSAYIRQRVFPAKCRNMLLPYAPIDQRVHRYFPDFIVKLKQKNGKETTLILEVKPESQTKQPVRKRKTQRFIQESVTYAVNQEKWRAADLFCKEHGWQFKVLTEKDLGI